ncbi:MAG: hypothetical protein KDD55_05475 [Bdellovibrionales bacterium]|nr:hypothetical protein [Bdellovibrionales bacterium]
MSDLAETIQNEIHEKVSELAKRLGNDASSLSATDIIPETGLLDSASIIELVVWLESQYSIRLAHDEITVENLGSLESMRSFVMLKQGQSATAHSS